MEKGTHARLGAASGLVALVVMIVGFAVFTADVPKLDDPVQDWQAYFTDHSDRIQIGATIVGVALFFGIWFLGSLRDAIASAEGGTGRLASVAQGGGLIAVVALMVGLTGAITASMRPGELDPTLSRALYEFGFLLAAPAAAAFTAMFGATAVAGYRHGAFPAPVAGFSALAALGQPFAFGTAFTNSGAFAADGVLGLWVPFVTFVVGWVAISGNLVKQTGDTS